MIPKVTVDMTGLNRGMELAQQYSRTAPADACNYTAREVAFGAYENTPVTGAARVDSDMGTIVTAKIGVRGGVVKGKRYAGGETRRVVRNGKIVEVPLAVLIVQKRGVAGSNYNELTGGRYALPGSPFKGVSRSRGRAAMQALVDAMIKGRRRAANGFIRAGWLTAIRFFKALAPGRYGSGRSVTTSGQQVTLGDAVAAQRGRTETYAIVENDVGLRNRNPHHNEAMQRVGTPALQSAVDVQGRREMEFFLRKSGQEELAAPVNRAWGS